VVIDQRVALHTAARRYCADQYAHWMRCYGERDFDITSPRAEAIYPRYNVLAAILVDVGSVLPQEFATLDDLRAFLIAAGQTAEDAATRYAPDPLAERAMAEQRAAFGGFIERITLEGLRDVDPLPYRRSLSGAESATLWSRLRHRWGLDEGQYWYPLTGQAAAPHTLAFHADQCNQAISSPVLRHILERHGVARVWELSAARPVYEIPPEQVEPEDADYETYWTAGELGWLIYLSHESTITIAGRWLVAAVQAAWPAWTHHLHTAWDVPPSPPATT